jgi:hypothetical protein
MKPKEPRETFDRLWTDEDAVAEFEEFCFAATTAQDAHEIARDELFAEDLLAQPEIDR